MRADVSAASVAIRTASSDRPLHARRWAREAADLAAEVRLRGIRVDAEDHRLRLRPTAGDEEEFAPSGSDPSVEDPVGDRPGGVLDPLHQQRLGLRVRERKDALALPAQVGVGATDVVGEVVLDRQLQAPAQVLGAREVSPPHQARAEVVVGVDEGGRGIGLLGDLDRLARPLLAGIEVRLEHDALGAEAVRHRQLRARSEALEAVDREIDLALRLRLVAEQPAEAAEPAARVEGGALRADRLVERDRLFLELGRLVDLAEQVALLRRRLDHLGALHADRRRRPRPHR